MQIFFQAFIFLVVIALTAKTYHIVFAARNKIACTSAMMAAMIGGSMAGLISGTLLALQQSFSMNSLLAMIVGIGAGLLIGLPFNAMAMLDGILAGVMGGLMGAMMGDMLAEPFILPLAFVLLLIFGLCTVLLNQAAKQEAGNAEQSPRDSGRIIRLTFLAASIAVVLFSALLAGSYYGKNGYASIPEKPHEHHHMTE